MDQLSQQIKQISEVVDSYGTRRYRGETAVDRKDEIDKTSNIEGK
jgi:hypothetical protein